MRDRRSKFWNGLGVGVGVLLTAGVLAVVWSYLTTSSSLPSLGFFALGPKPDAWQVQFAARFFRQQDAAAVQEDLGPVRCRLAPWQGVAEGNEPPPDLRLELTNTSTDPVQLWYVTAPHCHVTFLVREEAGGVLGSFCFGNYWHATVGGDPATGRPKPLPPVLTLQPGETYEAGIRLSDLRNGCSGRRRQGFTESKRSSFTKTSAAFRNRTSATPLGRKPSLSNCPFDSRTGGRRGAYNRPTAVYVSRKSQPP